jgi:hypothetical protein
MELNIYSIYDSAAQAFVTPFHIHNDGLAIRAFQDQVNSKEENNISKHPEQFTLFKLGKFDDKKGEYIIEKTPVSIAIGVELITDTTPRYSNTDLEKVQKELAFIREILKEDKK